MTRLLLGFAALTLLAACGVQGGLARPDPMWNRESAIRSECHREQTHREHLDARCRQSMTIQPQSGAAAVTPPNSPTAPSANGTIDPSSPATAPDTTTTDTTATTVPSTTP